MLPKTITLWVLVSGRIANSLSIPINLTLGTFPAPLSVSAKYCPHHVVVCTKFLEPTVPATNYCTKNFTQFDGSFGWRYSYM